MLNYICGQTCGCGCIQELRELYGPDAECAWAQQLDELRFMAELFETDVVSNNGRKQKNRRRILWLM